MSKSKARIALPKCYHQPLFSRTGQMVCYVAMDEIRYPVLHNTCVMLPYVPFHNIKTPGLTLCSVPDNITFCPTRLYLEISATLYKCMLTLKSKVESTIIKLFLILVRETSQRDKLCPCFGSCISSSISPAAQANKFDLLITIEVYVHTNV